MKKVLLSTAAVATVFCAAQVSAKEDKGVELGLAGQFRGYGVYVNQEEDTNEVRNVDIIRETEVHFKGKMTLDNGLTVGAWIEGEADQGDSFAVNESYVYFSGDWGKVNFGSEDSTTFLLQVAAPSADSNVDGVRNFVYPFNYTVAGTAVDAEQDYDHNVTGKADKLSYITPVFSGFQAGVSYTPEVRTSSRSLNGVDDDESSTSEFGDAIEFAARYEGEFDGFGMKAGAGYTHASVETDSASVDDRTAWNAGVSFDIGDFGIGAAYTVDDKGTQDDEERDIVVGASYDLNDVWTLGASYYNQDDEVGTDVETDRYSVGAVYSYGPGMSFRGSVYHVNHDITGADDYDGTAVLMGTEIKF